MDEPARKKVYVLLVLIVILIYIPAFFFSRNMASIQEKSGETALLPIYGSDSQGYVSLAENLLNNGNFGHDKGLIETFRTPGFPLLLAAWRSVFSDYRLYPILQIIFVLVSSVLIYEIARSVISWKAGVAASLLFIIDPNTVYHAMVVLSEISYTLLLIFALYLIVAKPKLFIPLEFAAGLMLGFAALVRPVSFYLPLLFISYFVVLGAKRFFSWRKVMISSLLLFVSYCAVLTPWLLRNYSVSGVFDISSVPALNLFNYTIPQFLAYKNGTSAEFESEKLYAKAGIMPEDADELSNSSIMKKIAGSHIWDNPFSFTLFYAVKSVPFFVSSGVGNIQYTLSEIRGVPDASYSINMTSLILSGRFSEAFAEMKRNSVETVEQLILLLACILALFALANKARRLDIILLLMVIVYFAGVTNVASNARLRIPVSPLIYILAIVGLFNLGGIIKRLRSKSFLREKYE